MRGDALWACDTEGNGQRLVASFDGLSPSTPALSPDGAFAAVAAGLEETTGLAHIYLVPMAGGAPKRLFLTGITGAKSPAFSPDGKYLAVVAASDVQKDADGMTFATMSISLVAPTGGSVISVFSAPETLLDTGYVYNNPTFAPDWNQGKGRLAYQSSGSDVSGGFVILDQNGNEIYAYPTDQADYSPYWRPQFFPDGRRVLVWSPAIQEGGANQIFIIDTKNGEKSLLTEGTRPALVDKGTAVVFQRCSDTWSEKDCALWRIDLQQDATPYLLVKGAKSPSGAPASMK